MNKLPAGWDEGKVKRIIDHYETQTEDDAVTEDEAALSVEETLMQIPVDLIGDVRALIAKGQTEH